MSKGKSSKSERERERLATDEDLFWQWAVDQGAHWVRYSSDVAFALASPSAALILASAIHKSCIKSDSVHAQGRWFYMSVKDWMRELVLRECDVMRSLSLLCVDVRPRVIQFVSESAGRGRPKADGTRGPKGEPKRRRAAVGFGGLGLLQRMVANRNAKSAAPVSHYRVDFERLRAWWTLNGVGQTVMTISSDRGNRNPQTEDIDMLLPSIPISSWPTRRLPVGEETSGDDGQGMGNVPEDQQGRQQNTHTAPSAPDVCVSDVVADTIYHELVVAGIWANVARNLAWACARQGWQASEVRTMANNFAEQGPIILRREIESLIEQGVTR